MSVRSRLLPIVASKYWDYKWIPSHPSFYIRCWGSNFVPHAYPSKYFKSELSCQPPEMMFYVYRYRNMCAHVHMHLKYNFLTWSFLWSGWSPEKMCIIINMSMAMSRTSMLQISGHIKAFTSTGSGKWQNLHLTGTDVGSVCIKHQSQLHLPQWLQCETTSLQRPPTNINKPDSLFRCM